MAGDEAKPPGQPYPVFGQWQLPPQPVSLQIFMAAAQLPTGEKMLVLQILTPCGVNTFYLDPEFALKFSADVAETAHKLGAGGLAIVSADSPIGRVINGTKKPS
jgi:hypothetical protein